MLQDEVQRSSYLARISTEQSVSHELCCPQGPSAATAVLVCVPVMTRLVGRVTKRLGCALPPSCLLCVAGWHVDTAVPNHQQHRESEPTHCDPKCYSRCWKTRPHQRAPTSPWPAASSSVRQCSRVDKCVNGRLEYCYHTQSVRSDKRKEQRCCCVMTHFSFFPVPFGVYRLNNVVDISTNPRRWGLGTPLMFGYVYDCCAGRANGSTFDYANIHSTRPYKLFLSKRWYMVVPYRSHP